MEAIAPLMGEIKNDAGRIEKKQNTVETQAVHHSLVSKRQKLRAPERQENQPTANATVNGPQGRMAPLKPLSLHRQSFWLHCRTEISKHLSPCIYSAIVDAEHNIKGAHTELIGISPRLMQTLLYHHWAGSHSPATSARRCSPMSSMNT